MEVQKEAQRIMTMSVWKMYHSRMQRGGLRLHRSLQLSLVMRNARDLYLSAKLEEDDEGMAAGGPGPGEDFAGRQQQPQPDSQAPGPPRLEGAPPPPGAQALERLPLEAPRPLETPLPASAEPEPMETQEEPSRAPAPPDSRTSRSRGASSGPPPGAAKPSRKRRSSSLGKIGAAEAGLVPSKKAKLVEEDEGERQPQRQEGPFPSLARVLQDRFAGLILPTQAAVAAAASPDGAEPKASCRQGDGVLSIMVRAVVAF